MQATNLTEKFALIHEHWRPKVVGALNGQEVKLVKIQGVFPWHRHETEDELFLVWRGQMQIEFRDRVVTLNPGEFCIVPHGVEHRTLAAEEAEVLVAVSMAISATITETWQLDVFWGLLSGLGTGIAGGVLGAAVAARWFVAQRGLAGWPCWGRYCRLASSAR